VGYSFMFILDQMRRGKHHGEVFNLGLSNANLSKLELAEKIKQYIPKLSIQSDEFSSDKDKRNYIVSNKKIESLGWTPIISLDHGINELIHAYPVLFGASQVFTNQ
jgi:nucleoside-diphosphate-sugar epimerase